MKHVNFPIGKLVFVTFFICAFSFESISSNTQPSNNPSRHSIKEELQQKFHEIGSQEKAEIQRPTIEKYQKKPFVLSILYWCKNAIDSLIDATEDQTPNGQFNLIINSLDKSQQTVMESLIRAAERGHTGAQLYVGQFYEYGYPWPRNSQKALEWYTKSAERGNAQAQYALGKLYSNNRDSTLQNNGKAAMWFEQAAMQGHAEAQFSLGQMYAYGIHTPTNYKKAVKWYTKAAEQGHGPAQLHLAMIYDNGKEGIEPDKQKAIKWYTRAAEQNISCAETLLSRALNKSRKNKK